MRSARILVHGITAGRLVEQDRGRSYEFEYFVEYAGPPVSLTMPVSVRKFSFSGFPPFFEGLLPEGAQLDALLARGKLDRDDCFGQLVAVGRDMVGAVTAEEVPQFVAAGGNLAGAVRAEEVP